MGSGQRSYSNVSGASKDYLNLFPKQGSLEGAPVITLHPRSGGPVAQASAVATPTVRRTDLVLAKIENHTLNSSLLAADDPGLAETLALISEGSKFEKLFLDDYVGILIMRNSAILPRSSASRIGKKLRTLGREL